ALQTVRLATSFHPIWLTDGQAYDVAGYIVSQKRREKAKQPRTASTVASSRLGLGEATSWCSTRRMSHYYNLPKSDHFDGERFFDPQGVPPRSRRDLLRWHLDRRWRAPKAKWPDWAPSPYADRPPHGLKARPGAFPMSATPAC